MNVVTSSFRGDGAIEFWGKIYNCTALHGDIHQSMGNHRHKLFFIHHLIYVGRKGKHVLTLRSEMSVWSYKCHSPRKKTEESNIICVIRCSHNTHTKAGSK